jgi:D-serine deaminase-like pyridoxal phosphate-dependent protein
MSDLAALTAATAHLPAPLVALDLPAVRANAADLVRRAAGTPVRVASKSVRCRYVLDLALGTPGFAGVMAYSVREAIWLTGTVAGGVLLGYPSADRDAIAELGADPALVEAITLMVDGAEQLELIRSATDAPVRVCLDIDASLRIGRLHLGARRSPLRTRPTPRGWPPSRPGSGCGLSASCSTRRRSPGCRTAHLPSGWSRRGPPRSCPGGAARSCPLCRTRSAGRWSW